MSFNSLQLWINLIDLIFLNHSLLLLFDHVNDLIHLFSDQISCWRLITLVNICNLDFFSHFNILRLMFLNEKSLAHDDLSWLKCIASLLPDVTTFAWTFTLRLLFSFMLSLTMRSHVLINSTYILTIFWLQLVTSVLSLLLKHMFFERA